MHELIDAPKTFSRALAGLARGWGSFGVDVERASGYRYDANKPWLIQVFRRPDHCYLFDPHALKELELLDQLWQEELVVIHAAINDLPSLGYKNLRPQRLFDTELASRLLGLSSVKLGAVLEQFLGVRLSKSYAQVNWSRRPIKTQWLKYAAEDVLFLVDLAEALEQRLQDEDKLDIARQEFAAILEEARSLPRKRSIAKKISGLDRLKDPVQRGRALSLGRARDQLGQKLDRSPRTLLRDSSLITLAVANPQTLEELSELEVITAGELDRSKTWLRALRLALPDLSVPKSTRGPQLGRADAQERFDTAKELAIGLADQMRLPTENLVRVSALRDLARSRAQTLADISVFLADKGLRPWQITLLSQPLEQAFGALEVKDSVSKP